MRIGPIRISTRVDHAGLARLYAGREPFSWAGPGQIEVSAFPSDAGPHWHYVALGARAGLGHELTFRLATSSTREPPPRWPVELLGRLARHAVGCPRRIGEGWYVCFERPLDPAGALRAVALVRDPELDDAMLAVGLRESELAVVSGDGYRRLLEALRARAPLLVTEPARAPLV